MDDGDGTSSLNEVFHCFLDENICEVLTNRLAPKTEAITAPKTPPALHAFAGGLANRDTGEDARAVANQRCSTQWTRPFFLS